MVNISELLKLNQATYLSLLFSCALDFAIRAEIKGEKGVLIVFDVWILQKSPEFLNSYQAFIHFAIAPFPGVHGYSYHMVFKEEQRSFSNWISANLGGMPELAHLMPLMDDGADLYEKIGDGILLW